MCPSPSSTGWPSCSRRRAERDCTSAPCVIGEPLSRVGAFPIGRDLDAHHHDALVADFAGAVTSAADVVGEQTVARANDAGLTEVRDDLVLAAQQREEPALGCRMELVTGHPL